ncbi:MAG: BlaI/MecI/CopY family transcriptional regulator [Vicinamibacterales bacterium]
MPRLPSLTPLELEIMHIVWATDEVSVRAVYETLRRRRPIAYTTVMTMLAVLTRKGHVTRRAQGRAYLYRATKPKRAVVRRLVRDFVDRVFLGAADALVVHLLESEQLTPADLDALRRRAREAEGRK